MFSSNFFKNIIEICKLNIDFRIMPKINIKIEKKCPNMHKISKNAKYACNMQNKVCLKQLVLCDSYTF